MDTLGKVKSAFWRAIAMLALFSAGINILLLAQSIYSIQVYDRVLPSRSTDTLIYLSVMMAAALLATSLLDVARSLVANRAAQRFEVRLSDTAMRIVLRKGSTAAHGMQPLRDIASLRAFISSRALIAILDLPFAGLFIAMMYFVHPHLFWLTLVGAGVLTLVAALSQWALSASAEEQGELSQAATIKAEHISRSAESVVAMGMTKNVIDAWGQLQAGSLLAADGAGTMNAWFAGVSKFLRFTLQTAVLGYGALLVLENQMSPGLMFAASIISGRALQPIDQMIGAWRQISYAQEAWKRVKSFVPKADGGRRHTSLPAPNGVIDVTELHYPDPADPSRPPILGKLSFRLEPGEIVAVLGPSGSGKSTMARLLVGALQPRSGQIRIDGYELQNWNPEELGRATGYVAQEVELLPGTVGQNISRFDPDARDADIVQAARAAHAEDLVQRLPKGYDTEIGPGEMHLSGGERQRIALARALYGKPRFLVLDEPNSNLDRQGEAALMEALSDAKAAGATILVITQRETLLACADKIMRLQGGGIVEFDDKEAIMARHREDSARAPRPMKMARQAAGA
ncbi:MAG: type I secretion system permease/ATPase [Aestuariivirga sp.]|uniref:type I secretion system permease/ATPase n=1 Tax=Aestuariivirga sp. TaxID=2650926 RepID=UPI0038CF8215